VKNKEYSCRLKLNQSLTKMYYVLVLAVVTIMQAQGLFMQPE